MRQIGVGAAADRVGAIAFDLTVTVTTTTHLIFSAECLAGVVVLTQAEQSNPLSTAATAQHQQGSQYRRTTV